MLRPKYQFWVYILASQRNGTLYIGYTNNLERRVFEHKNKVNESFTKRYKVDKLVYYEEHQYVTNAFKRERQMKSWKRQWKIELIESMNPSWTDLAEDWYD